MPGSTSITQLQAEARRELKAAGDPRIAAQARVYFKPDEKVRFYGVNAPTARKIARGLSARVRGAWGLDEAMAFCEAMLREPEAEAKSVGILVLADFKRQFDGTMARTIEGWLEEGLCADWATTDGLCMSVLGPLLGIHPELVAKLRGWTRRRSLWLRRASAVPLTYYARRGRHLDEVYEIAEALFDYPEDLIHKANGWLLRDAGKTDPARLEAFLLAHGPRIPRTTIRYAIEKFPPARRKTLLACTRSTN
ncbi:MAG: DNA alkylation repair protein [Blastocatellia bacterium]|nr:DNA alkylation repair protein [Blastocatellia bacterium]